MDQPSIASASLRRSARTNKFSGFTGQGVSKKRERKTRPFEKMDDKEFRQSSKYTQDDTMSSRTSSQQLASSCQRRSARITKFSNPYGYVEKKIPVGLLFKNSIPRTGGTLDKSKIKLPIQTKREKLKNAREQAFYVALARARLAAPPQEPPDEGVSNRSMRQCDAREYRKRYSYGPEKDGKTCIWSAGGRHSWSELSSGITWVAVQGVHHTCAVSRRIPGVDPARLSHGLKMEHENIRWARFLKVVIAEMEDTSATSAFYQEIDQRAKMSPYAVVSVSPLIDGSSSEASSAPSGEKECIDFLIEKLRDGKVFSANETVQTAFSALQHLSCQKFKSNEIVAYLMESGGDEWQLMSSEEVAKSIWTS